MKYKSNDFFEISYKYIKVLYIYVYIYLYLYLYDHTVQVFYMALKQEDE